MRTRDRATEGDAANDDRPTDAATAPADGVAPPRARKGRGATAEAMRQVRERRAEMGFSSYGRGNFKVDHLLTDDDRPAYHALLRDPKTTQGIALQWLQARGYPVGLHAVVTHRSHFRDELKRMRRAAEVAHAFAGVARECGIGVVADATAARAEQLLMEQLFRLDDDGEQLAFTPKEWQELNKAIGEAIANRRSAEAMRADAERAKRQAVDAVAEAHRGKPDGEAVVDRVREILGLPADDDDPLAPE